MNCANYSITEDYWHLGGRPTVDETRSSYSDCMKNEDCIIQTIWNYTGRFRNAVCIVCNQI